MSIKFFFFSLFLLASFLSLLYSDNSIFIKEKAIKEEILKLGFKNSTLNFDNFISKNGSEYAIVYLNSTAFFLFEIKYINKSIFLNPILGDDVEKVILSRPAYGFLEQSNISFQNIFSAKEKLKKEINLSILKYSLLTGLSNSTCFDLNSCKEVCGLSNYCQAVYSINNNSDEILISLIEFSNTKKQLNELFSSEDKFYLNISNKSRKEVLLFYYEFFDSLNKIVQNYNQLRIQKENNPFYAGQILSNPDFSNTLNLIQKDLIVLNNSEFIFNMIDSIKENSNKYLLNISNSIEFSNFSEVNQSNLENQANFSANLEPTSKQLELTKEEFSVQKPTYLVLEPINSTVLFTPQNNFSRKITLSFLGRELDLLITTIAIILVLFALIKILVLYFSRLTKEQARPRFSDLFREFSKKKIKSLEDLN